MRIFLACEFGRATADRLHAELESLRRAYSGAAFTSIPAANYHVTLRFFGELTSSEVDRVARLAEPVAAAGTPIDCHAISAQPLPNARRPNVIALPIESGGRLEKLAVQFRVAFEDEFGRPDKPFKAHVTVIRCRRDARYFEHAHAIDFPLTFSRIALYESTSGNGAPRYTVLRAFPLAASAASIGSGG